MDRRAFFRYSALTGIAVAGSASLLACSSESTAWSGGASNDGSEFGTVAVRLSWIKNIEFAGEYLPRQGYHKDAGFGNVELVGGAAGPV